MTAIHFMVDWQRHRDLPQTQIQTQTETETHRILHTQCCLKCTCVCVSVCGCVCGCVCNVAYSCWFLWPHSQCNRALIDTVNDMHIMFACACVCVCVYVKQETEMASRATRTLKLRPLCSVSCVCLQVLIVAACLMTNLMCFACWNVLFQLQQQVMQLIEATHTYTQIYSYITHTIQHR